MRAVDDPEPFEVPDIAAPDHAELVIRRARCRYVVIAELFEDLVGVLAVGRSGSHREVLAGHHKRVAEGEEVAEQRMVFGDDLARHQVRVVLNLVEVHRGAHGDVVVDRDLHPLGQRLGVKDLLQLQPQVVLAAAEVDDEIRR